MMIIDRESGGNPLAKNPTSTASGLLQFLSSWWSGRWDPFDAYQNLHHGYDAWRQVRFQPWAL
jgi:muramidase (phage lysozyme)